MRSQILSAIRVHKYPDKIVIEPDDYNWNLKVVHLGPSLGNAPLKNIQSVLEVQKQTPQKKVECTEVPVITSNDSNIEIDKAIKPIEVNVEGSEVFVGPELNPNIRRNIYADSYTAADLFKKYDRKASYLLGKVFPSVGMGGLIADKDVGKSSLALQLSLAISYGSKEVIGFPINARHKRVLYFAAEDFEEDMQEYISEQMVGLNKKDPPSGLKFLFNSEDPIKAIEVELESRHYDMIVIDTFNHLQKGSINLSHVVSESFHVLQKIARKHKCFFLIVHHSGKGKGALKPSMDNALGSGNIPANLKVQIELKKDPEEINIIHFCIVKGNKLKEVEKQRSYKLRRDDHRLLHPTGERVLLTEIMQKKIDPQLQVSLPRSKPNEQRSKLTHEKKKEIIERLKKGERQTVLAFEYGVSQGAISQLWTAYNRGELILE